MFFQHQYSIEGVKVFLLPATLCVRKWRGSKQARQAIPLTAGAQPFPISLGRRMAAFAKTNCLPLFPELLCSRLAPSITATSDSRVLGRDHSNVGCEFG